MYNTFEELRQVIELSNSIAISGHVSPDGDAVGSCAALAMSLKYYDKDVKVIIDEYPENFNLIPTAGLFINNPDEDYLPDLYISLDCGDKERLGKNANLFDKTLHTINIDHHRGNTCFGKLNYVDEEASSTSEIVFQLLYGYSPLDKDIASAIYSGIVFDTGGFRHPSTSPVTMAIVSELMEYDFDFNKIYNSIFHSRSLAEAKIMGMALCKLKTHFNGKCVSTYITASEMSEYGITGDDVSEVSGYIKGIKGALASVFLYEKEDGVYKASMRSDDPVSVWEVAQNFGGGGHIHASGCTLKGDPEEILDKILKEIEKQL